MNSVQKLKNDDTNIGSDLIISKKHGSIKEDSDNRLKLEKRERNI
ncbi:MAG TPA: hypothetical protein VH500_07335 [Nitrososphaeraceae archaeon]